MLTLGPQPSQVAGVVEVEAVAATAAAAAAVEVEAAAAGAATEEGIKGAAVDGATRRVQGWKGPCPTLGWVYQALAKDHGPQP